MGRKKMWVTMSLCTSFALAMVLLWLGSAQAVEVKVSGQINRAVMWADDGNNSEVFHVDNDNSSTRFRLTGSEKVSDSVKVGVTWETEFQSTPSNKVVIGQDNDISNSSEDLDQRKLEAYFVLPFGKISIGQGDGAANGTSEMDLSGTGVAIMSSVVTTAQSLQFRTSDDTIVTTVGDTRNNFDGLSRNDRLRYDTPKFNGFYLSASTTNGDAKELAAYYVREFDGFGKIAGAIGYVYTADRGSTEYNQVGASLSYLHTSGINLSVAYGKREIEDSTTDDPVNYYGKLGYKFGIHSLAVEYGMTKDLEQEGDESRNYGLAYVVTPWKGVEIFGLYRQFSLDRDGEDDINDINQIMIGTRVKF